MQDELDALLGYWKMVRLTHEHVNCEIQRDDDP